MLKLCDLFQWGGVCKEEAHSCPGRGGGGGGGGCELALLVLEGVISRDRRLLQHHLELSASHNAWLVPGVMNSVFWQFLLGRAVRAGNGVMRSLVPLSTNLCHSCSLLLGRGTWEGRLSSDTGLRPLWMKLLEGQPARAGGLLRQRQGGCPWGSAGAASATWCPHGPLLVLGKARSNGTLSSGPGLRFLWMPPEGLLARVGVLRV